MPIITPPIKSILYTNPMHLFKKLLLFLIFLLPIVSITTTPIHASTPNLPLTQIEILSRPDCQHCVDLKNFLDQLKSTRSDFTYTEYNIYESQGLELFNRLTQKESLPKATPIILIGTHILQGFNTPETTGQDIILLLDKYKDQPTYTLSEFLDQNIPSQTLGTTADTCTDECTIDNSYYLNLPYLGRINAADYSLPILAFILGFIDGFNPCAMWVLVSFIVILAQVGNRQKMLIFAGLFIVAETIMYYLILTVWYTAWDFIGLDRIITPLVGIIAIGGGLFFLWEWYKNDGACHITDLKQQQQTTTKIRQLASQPLTLLTALGIIGIAFSVNIIEFACSIGIPQAFTKILEVNDLSLLNTQINIALYILAYMIDDLIVFSIALYSFEKIGLTTKYTRATQIIGGLLMLILGGLLLFNPSLLIFN